MSGLNGKQLLGAALAVVTLVSGGAAEDPSGVVLWDKTINLRGAFGYKDNVLLSSIQEHRSAFWQSAIDVMLLRLNTDPRAGTFSFFVTGEDRRYFSSVEVQKEQLVLSQAKWEQPFLGQWKWGAIAQYMYADQVFDASATEELLQTLPVKSHNLQTAPYLSRTLPLKMRLEFKGTLERQYFSDPLDDYWEGGPQLTLSKSYGHRSEISLSYIYDRRSYDTRRQYDLQASAIPGSSLAFDQHEIEASLLHVWDKDRHWRSRLRALYERNHDNGPGFYDYHRYRWSKRLGYYGSDWEATLEGKILHYDYLRQPAFGGVGIRQVWEYTLAVRAEKMLWKKLKVFGEGEHEKVDSNSALEEYTVNTVLGGIDWEF